MPAWNGLDDVQVSDDQRTLTLHFLGKAPAALRAANVVIAPVAGGAAVRVLGLRVCREEDRSLDDCVEVRVDRPGSWGEYRLCLKTLDDRGRPTADPLEGFDPRLSCLTFSFKVNCPSELDCAPGVVCPPGVPDEPDLNYLARDYASLRQLLLDRMAASVPAWRERHVPDLGVTLIELMAFAGDRFSAEQDAVATEAYLDTARLRRSVRRHARLVDYRLHDGCNARSFVQVRVNGAPGAMAAFDPRPGELQFTGPAGSPVFEPLLPGPVRWWAVQNEMTVYTWGEPVCALETGAVLASLDAGPLDEPLPEGRGNDSRDNPLRLHAGDFLLLEEVLGPRTGHVADARPERRQVVRLTRVELTEDRLYGRRVVNVEWGPADALRFDLCLAGRSAPPECRPLRPGVARGNVLPVDHGETLHVSLPAVPALPVTPDCDDCGCGPASARPGIYAPVLTPGPLTVRQSPVPVGPASALTRQDPRQALPDLSLTDSSGTRWTPRADLLGSGPDDTHFVVEFGEWGEASLRFGTGGLGRPLEAGQSFTAQLRRGSGTEGNVGLETLTRLSLSGRLRLPEGVSVTVRQPLAGQGGEAPEPLDEARRQAPAGFNGVLKRAVTAEDYADLARWLFADRVQRAAASWSGTAWASRSSEATGPQVPAE